MIHLVASSGLGGMQLMLFLKSDTRADYNWQLETFKVALKGAALNSTRINYIIDSTQVQGQIRQ